MTGVLAALAVAVAIIATVDGAEAADVFAPDTASLERVEAMLPATPGRLGPTVDDRRAWSALARRKQGRELVARAVAVLNEPLPEITDDLYLDYSRTGNRRRGEAALSARRSRIPALVLGECVEGAGRFLPALEETLRSVCAEKSWVLPAHDANLENFRGKLVTIDLASSALGWTLATTEYLLGSRLSPDTRRVVRDALQTRIFEPYRRMCAGEQPQWWLLARMNWNSVCLAGVTGAALTGLTDRRERAWYVLAAEHYSMNALKGFTEDGYCDEGVSYWNYGFGHYAVLAETVRRATNGGVDLMARREAIMPSAYGFRIEIVPGICPAFADCPVNAAPSPGLMAYLNRRFHGPTNDRERRPIAGGLCDQVMALFPDDARAKLSRVDWPDPDPLRTWFPAHSVLIGRPAKGSRNRLSVALQGGHNAQNHNHNDVGVFMVVVGRTAVLPDIGAEVYTRRTFSARRYDSRALNSWGHAVPVIDGQLQRTGRQAEAKVLKREFTPERDAIVMDIRSAYAVQGIETLERSFTYDRTGTGSFTVEDRFAWDRPRTYETALLTFGTWDRIDANTIRIADGPEAVHVRVTAPEGARLEVRAEPVEEDLSARRPATRIGLRLADPLKAGSFRLFIEPESKPGPAALRRLPEIVAHRGASAEAPENTLAAFRTAFEQGIRTVELDVWLTSEGIPVVSHDGSTERTSGEKLTIQATPLAQLQQLDVGRWKGARWQGERMPTLAEALALLHDDRRCFIEVKAGPEAVDPVAQVIEASGVPLTRLTVISFNEDVVGAMKRRLPAVKTQYLAAFRKDDHGAWTPEWDDLVAKARSIQADAINVHYGGPITAESVRRARAAGLGVFVWTVDDLATAQRVAAAGVDGITSNRPAYLRAALGRTRAAAPKTGKGEG